VKQIRVEKPKHRRDRADSELLALDPRDTDIVRAKALSRAARSQVPAASPADGGEGVLENGQPLVE